MNKREFDKHMRDMDLPLPMDWDVRSLAWLIDPTDKHKKGILLYNKKAQTYCLWNGEHQFNVSHDFGVANDMLEPDKYDCTNL